MNAAESMIEALRASGQRMTVARRTIIRVIADAAMPMTAVAILAALQKQRLTINKTTVYRELKFLEAKHVLNAMQFDERNKRYELTPEGHKHHLICTGCKTIENIVLDHDLDEVEQKLTAQSRFKVQRHALEFYGLCGKCQE